MNAAQIIEPSVTLAPLAILDSVPYGYGVVAMAHDSVLFRAGEVVIYDPGSIAIEGLVDQGIYAIEYQSFPNGMTWQIARTHIDKPRIKTRREVVRLARSTRDPDMWMLHPLAHRNASGAVLCSDGPMLDFHIADLLVGRVIGLYTPTAIGGRT